MPKFECAELDAYLAQLEYEYKKANNKGALMVLDELRDSKFAIGKKEYDKIQRGVENTWTNILEARFGPEEDWVQDFRKVNLGDY